MTGLEVKEDADVLERLDWDADPACEIHWPKTPDCDQPAVGAIRCRGCLTVHLSSRACWHKMARIAAEARVQCFACRTPGPFRELFEFVPFGGAS